KLFRIGHAPDPGPSGKRLREPMPTVPLRPLGSGRVACVAIGASTGGLHALSDLLRALPPSFAAPILITQHLPPSFMNIFAMQVQEMSRRPTSVARAGTPLARGRILVAPGEGHLSVEMSGGMP